MSTPRKTLPVLAYLLLHRDAAVSRNFLSFLLWPDETEDSARAKLRATLHDLARALPEAPEGYWIAVEGTNIRWNPDAQVSLDVDDFNAAIANPELLNEAANLYAGDFLEALYDEWIVAPRERYRAAYLGVLTQLVSRSRSRRDYQSGISYAKRLLEADPLREDVARRLITMRYEAGDRAGALEEYERFETRVRDELGIDPMPETAAVREAIVRNDVISSDETVSTDDTAPVARARATLPFVGRRDMMEQLLDGWSRAARGRGGVIFIGGDPGIGKSRLVSEFAREVDERGGRVLVGATGSPETMPYQAFVEALRSALPLVAALKMEAVWLAALATLLPELSARVPDLPALSHIEPENERARLFGALTRAFVALAQPRPMLLVLEDLHWAEEGTIAALVFLARRLALSPILAVATYRDNETVRRHPLRRARHEAMVDGTARSLSLRPFTIDEVDQLTQLMPTMRAASASALLAASEGNPLLLGHLLEEPADVRFDRPPSVGDVVEARLARLSPEARRVGEIAALVGTRFSREVVRDVGGWDEATFNDALDELLDRRIVREATGRGALDYAFAHQIVCDVVARSADPTRSSERHRRIARTLEELYPAGAVEFAAELGRHYELAGDAETAAGHYLMAARRALELAALDEAGAHLVRGLALARGPALRAALLVSRVRVTDRSGDRAAQAVALNDLSVVADVSDDPEWRRTAALLRVQFAALTANADEQQEALELLRSLAKDAGPRWKAAALLEEARVSFGFGDLEGLENAASAALAAARESQDEASAARALIRLADVETHRANLREAQAILDKAQASAALARDGDVEIDALRTAFILAYNMADVDRCITIAERWLERGIALGHRQAEADGRLRVAIALLTTRRNVARIRDEVSRAMAIYEELGSKRGMAALLINRGIFHNELCNFTAAAADTEKALELFTEIDDVRGRATALANLAEIRSVAGDRERGRQEGLASVELSRAAELRIQEACALDNLAIATAALGEIAEAIRIGESGLALHRESESAKWTGRALGDLALWHAQVGDLDAAKARVEEMLAPDVSVWAEWPQRFHWAAAQVLHWCGDDDRAKRELEKAHKLVADLAAELSGDDLARYTSAPWNQSIVAAYDSDEWPPRPV